MSAPVWSQIDDDTASILDLIADVDSPIGSDVPDLFLAACERDAEAHNGLVSVNRVRDLLAAEDIEHHRYSALWAAFTGRGKPMEKARHIDGEQMWETCQGSRTGNNGRPYAIRRWLGGAE